MIDVFFYSWSYMLFLLKQVHVHDIFIDLPRTCPGGSVQLVVVYVVFVKISLYILVHHLPTSTGCFVFFRGNKTVPDETARISYTGSFYRFITLFRSCINNH
jgi:hypothetical protein